MYNKCTPRDDTVLLIQFHNQGSGRNPGKAYLCLRSWITEQDGVAIQRDFCNSLNICIFSVDRERENTFQRPFFVGFECNMECHLYTIRLPPIPLYMNGISSKWCGSHKALNGFWFNFYNFSWHKGNQVGTLFCFRQHPETSCLHSHRYLYNKNCSKYLLIYCKFCEPARALRSLPVLFISWHLMGRRLR